MKKHAFSRTIDNVGRITIPVSYRKHLDIKDRDKIELMISGNSIILKKQDLTINYNELLKDIFAIKIKSNYMEHQITNEDIINFEKIIDKFVEELISIKKIK